MPFLLTYAASTGVATDPGPAGATYSFISSVPSGVIVSRSGVAMHVNASGFVVQDPVNLGRIDCDSLIDGAPPGSTSKEITGVAALSTGVLLSIGIAGTFPSVQASVAAGVLVGAASTSPNTSLLSVAASGSRGILTVGSVTVSKTGAAGAVGTPTVAVTSFASISGNAAAGLAGIPSPASSTGSVLSGTTATGTGGSVGFSSQPPGIFSSASTSSVGSLGITLAPGVLTGVLAVASRGTLFFSAINVPSALGAGTLGFLTSAVGRNLAGTAATTLLGTLAVGKSLFVATTGNDANPGTPASPFRTITAASVAATPGTTVHVAPGNYTDTLVQSSGSSGAPITYVSDTRHGAKILQTTGPTQGDAFWSSGDWNVVDGFEIDGSTWASGTYWNVGAYITGSNSTIKNCKIHDILTNPANAATQESLSAGGGGIVLESYYNGINIDAIGCTIYNLGPNGGTQNLIHGLYHHSTGNIKNCLIYNCLSGGISLWHDARSVNITNNTVFACNYGIDLGGGDYYNTTGPCDNCYIANNIIFSNVSFGLVSAGDVGTHNVYTNNCAFNNGTNYSLIPSGTVAAAPVTSNPLFVNYVALGGGDYHLASNSPCINAGIATNAPSIDLDQKTRPIGGAYDIGCYEATILSGVAGTTALGLLAKGPVVQPSVPVSTAALGTLTLNVSSNLTLGTTGLTTTLGALSTINGSSITLTGLAGTSSPGALTLNTSSSLTLGATIGTSTLGTVTQQVQDALTGLVGTSALGTVTPQVQSALVGLAGTSTLGTVTQQVQESLTGLAGTTAVGTLALEIKVALTGLVGTSALGTVTPQIQESLTGLAGTTAVGTMTASVPSVFVGPTQRRFIMPAYSKPGSSFPIVSKQWSKRLLYGWVLNEGTKTPREIKTRTAATLTAATWVSTTRGFSIKVAASGVVGTNFTGPSATTGSFTVMVGFSGCTIPLSDTTGNYYFGAKCINDNPDATAEWLIYLFDQSLQLWSGPSSSTPSFPTVLSKFNDGKFHTIAFTSGPANIQLFIDGISQGSQAGAMTIPASTNPVWIGAYSNVGDGTLPANYEFLYAFNKVLSAGEIRKLSREPYSILDPYPLY